MAVISQKLAKNRLTVRAFLKFQIVNDRRIDVNT